MSSIFDDIGRHMAERAAAGQSPGEFATQAANTVVNISEDALKIIAGILDGSAFFPDNVKRQARVRDLAGDIAGLSARLAGENQQIREGLQGLTQTIDDIYRSHGLTPPPQESYRPPVFDTVVWSANPMVLQLLAVGPVGAAFVAGIAAAAAEAGEITASAAAAALGADGLALGPVAAVMTALSALTGLINNAQRRPELQAAIHDNFAFRQRLQAADLKNTQLANALAGLSHAVSLLKELKIAAQSDLDKEVQNRIDAAAEVLKQETTKQAEALLAQKDAARGSWTSEDL